ncbi:alpha/beta hydrolase [Dactylosporangium sp. NPDC051485]|uniref:alpha/beta fold hydrolase n=1 Tax=Dactylosporangium sp. NPDC051485 TaxID=3154846 RepID=UPI003440EAC4
MITEIGVELGDGRLLHVYDTGGDGPVVYWHHGTPNIGEPPEPLFAASDRLGIRWIAHSRPGYGASAPAPGRSVASVAADAAAVADALGVRRFAVMGHSGGGPHALACAALLPDRVGAVVSISGLAPFEPSTASGFDWYAGMADGSLSTLRAAREGRAAYEQHLKGATGEEDIGFLPADWDALQSDWAWFDRIVPAALVMGPAGLIDDELAGSGAWGFDPAAVAQPALLLHGAADRMVPSTHSEWLAGRLPAAELRIVPDAGHITVMRHAAEALEWLAAHP